jgi:hypothetical protein
MVILVKFRMILVFTMRKCHKSIDNATAYCCQPLQSKVPKVPCYIPIDNGEQLPQGFVVQAISVVSGYEHMALLLAPAMAICIWLISNGDAAYVMEPITNTRSSGCNGTTCDACQTGVCDVTNTCG